MLAHVDLDAFYASAEELDNPQLKGLPVIVGGLEGRGVVSACSYAARALGVRSAMPMFKARKLCPQAVFMPARMAHYQELSNQVMNILAGFSPCLEQVSIDEAFLDLRGTLHLWGNSPLSAAQALQSAIKRQMGLSCSVGVAPLRFLAKIATERGKPGGVSVVEDVDDFISSIALKEISGVGESALARLREAGLTRLAELQDLPCELLERLLGRHGVKLWHMARGQDPRGVTPERTAKSIGHEITFEHDIADPDLLNAHLLQLCQKVARRLRGHELSAASLTLKIKFPDFRQKTFSRALAEPSADALEIYKILRGFLRPGQSCRLLGVTASRLSPPAPPGLFQKNKLNSLHRAEDSLYQRFGSRALTRAGALLAQPSKGALSNGQRYR